MKKGILIALAFIIVCAAAVFLYFQLRPEKPKGEHPSVVIIGLDGADWNIIDPLLERGKLPHIAAMVDKGSSGTLHTFAPTKSSVIWTSIATGKTMVKHGILDWYFVNKNKLQIPYSASERRVKAFWNIFSENEHTVGVVNWFCTFPPEEVNGFIVSDRFRASVAKRLPLREQVTYPFILNKKLSPFVSRMSDKQYKRLLDEEGLEDFFQLARREGIQIPEKREIFVKQFRRFFHADKSIENVSLYLLDKIPVELFATYFRLIDTTSHFTSMFVGDELQKAWKKETANSEMPTPETQKLLYAKMAGIIEPVYAYLDNVIGRIMDKAGQDAVYIVISDHGFNFSDLGYNHYDTPEVPHGIIIVKGPHVKSGYHITDARVFDVTPTILYLFDMPTAEDMDGKVLLDIFEESFAGKRPVRSIPTYEGPEGRVVKERSRELDKELLEEMKALGYIK